MTAYYPRFAVIPTFPQMHMVRSSKMRYECTVYAMAGWHIENAAEKNGVFRRGLIFMYSARKAGSRTDPGMSEAAYF
jgi:hypothetical protein